MASDPNRIEIDQIAGWLETHIVGFSNLTEITKFKGGQSNPSYLLTADSGQYVLRAKPPGKLLKSAHQVDREYRVMKALEDSAVPVPKMHALSQEESPIGRMFFVMEYLDGEIYWSPELSELAENENERRGRIYDEMNRVLAALHDVDVAQSGLSDFGVPGNYFERQLSRWTKQYLASEIDRNEDIHNLIAWLEKMLPPDDGIVSLVHGDYRLDNMVFSKESAKVLGVLDWELSTLGHPYADLAYQCMTWRLPNQGGFRGLGGIDRSAIGLPTEQEYVASYCRRRNIETIDNWFFYLAFSFFRLAAILQGVYKRAVDGNASNPQKAKTYGMAVPVMGKMANDMIASES